MKTANVKDNTNIYFDKKNNKEDPKLKDGDHVRISKYKSNFRKGYTPNWVEEVFMIVNSKLMIRKHLLLAILTVNKCLESSMKNNCKNQIQ